MPQAPTLERERYREPEDAKARRRKKELRDTAALPATPPPKPDATGPPPEDFLIPDPVIAKEFHITLMTLWRWTNDEQLGFPPAVQIRGKNFRSRNQIEQFKRDMVRKAIAARGKEVA
jgi:hypothetical protein